MSIAGSEKKEYIDEYSNSDETNKSDITTIDVKLDDVHPNKNENKLNIFYSTIKNKILRSPRQKIIKTEKGIK
jgi:hypothetical protein